MTTTAVAGMPTGTTAMGTPSSTSDSGGSSTSSSPLLFFVALGFGVLFTNLWIIVGVKYCFRYSQRNRRAAQGQPFEEEVDLATLHPFVGIHHPVQRRRREKKLLKIDEVNERFPVMTYKAWKARRERQGLSAEGGIATSNDTNVNGNVPVTGSGEVEYLGESAVGDEQMRESTQQPYVDVTRSTGESVSGNHTSESTEGVAYTPPEEITATSPPHEPQDITSEKQPVSTAIIEDSYDDPSSDVILPPSSSSKLHRDSTVSMEPDAEDDDAGIPNELLATSGDNCAICIELLEDEDEVRGLTCGHCYHQACLDPWLTQRRASCPLCKADYYIPKQLPTTLDPNDPTAITPATTNNTANAPVAVPENAIVGPQPQNVTTEHWAPIFFRPFRGPVVVPVSQGPSYPPPFGRFDRRSSTTTTTVRSPQANRSPSSPPPNATETGSRPGASRLRRIHVPNPFRRHQESDISDSLERGEGGNTPSSSS